MSSHTHHGPQEAPQTTAGLLLSLASTLPRSNPLARSCRRMAHALSLHTRPPRSLALSAADLLARLLDETDDSGDDPELLDPGFDD